MKELKTTDSMTMGEALESKYVEDIRKVTKC